MVNSIGLVMFLYGIGIQYGKQFFAGLRGPGLKWNLLAAAGVLGALAVALVLGGAFGVDPAYSMGMFAGSLTSTPTLQAAIDATGSRNPAIGYSVPIPSALSVRFSASSPSRVSLRFASHPRPSRSNTSKSPSINGPVEPWRS